MVEKLTQIVWTFWMLLENVGGLNVPAHSRSIQGHEVRRLILLIYGSTQPNIEVSCYFIRPKFISLTLFNPYLSVKCLEMT